MDLSFNEHLLHLRYPFILSDSRIDTKTVVLVRLEQDDIAGYGESSPSRYFGESVEDVTAVLGRVRDLAKQWDPWNRQSIIAQLAHLFPAKRSARSAVEMALWDWCGKALRIPVYKLLGLDPTVTPVSSMTIGLDEPAIVDKKIREAEGFPVLKIKLGAGDRDFEIIETVCRLTDRILRVDANEGWGRDEAARKIDYLASRNVELIEQPLAKENLEDLAWLKERSTLPIYADENVLENTDIPSMAGLVDGINIKLDKCGGLTEAVAMMHTAKAFGLKTMLGCMVQSSVGISAAAQLSPLADYADLDGHLLVRDDPARGVVFERGKIILDSRPGIGVEYV